MKIKPAELQRNETHNLLSGAIIPLPIGLVSTVGENGIHNAAPYSFLFPVSMRPPLICISISRYYGKAYPLREGQRKDTLKNIEFSEDFVINIMDEMHIKPTIQTSVTYPADVDEIKEVGLTAVASDMVKSPRVAEAQVSFECRLWKKMDMGEGEDNRGIVFGEVLLAHIKEGLWADGRIDASKLKTVGRIGNALYCRMGEIFELKVS